MSPTDAPPLSPGGDVPHRQRLRFGPFELLPTERRLLAAGRPLALGSRAFDLLLALIERRDRLVSKAELLELVWPGMVIEEANLPVQISGLRKLLGPQVVVTIPGRGYRFAMTLDSPTAGTLTSIATPMARSNVPAALDTLLGRDEDVDAVLRCLGEHRLVTVMGAGGIGKTRLAQAAASATVRAYADGVWWVDLAALSSAELIGPAIATAAQLQLAPGDASANLVRALAPRELLLVLDNCEHLGVAVATLVHTVLTAAARVRVLATSQAALQTGGEYRYRLSALAIPPADACLTTARRFAALQMLECRAQAADSRFQLTDANVGLAIDLCLQLDGVPLSIEMAAARLPLLGVHGLHARLGERLNMFCTGSREAPSRQQTLRATLAWSHDLLDEDQRAVLRRLAVFAASFHLDAAQRTAAIRGLSAEAVLDAIAGLVDKSFVAVDGLETLRYRMAETLRLFALEQLASSGETAEVQQRHALATLALLEDVDRRAWTLTGEQLNAQLGPEVANLRAALAWARGVDGDRAIGIALAARSAWLWDSLNLGAEGIANLLAMESWLDDSMPLPLQAAYWRARTFLFMGFGGRRDLSDAAASSIRLARQLGEPRLLSDALITSAIIAARAGRVDLAQSHLIECRALDDLSWPPRQRATRFFAEAECCEAADQLQEARAAQEMRIKLLVRAGERAVEIHAQSQLLLLELASGDTGAAIARGRRVLAELSLSCPPFRARSMQMALAQALIEGGQWDEALELVAKAVPLLAGAAAQWQALDLLSQLWQMRGDPFRAAQLLGCADRMYETHGLARKPDVLRRRARLLDGLRANLSGDELARSRTDGAALTEEEAITLAMDSQGERAFQAYRH